MVNVMASIAVLLALSYTAQAQTGQVLFQVTGIETELGGSISSGVFKKADFPKVGRQFRGKDLKVAQAEMEVLLRDVPVGTYGAVVFQDKNENRMLDTNLIGFPKEPIGFANGARIKLGPPSFEAAAITVVEGETVTVPIELR